MAQGEIAEQAERLLSVNNTTVQGIMLVIILVSWIVVWQFWKYNKELNEKLLGFTEKYFTISTKILSFLSRGKDV